MCYKVFPPDSLPPPEHSLCRWNLCKNMIKWLATASEQPKPSYSYRGEPFALESNSRVCNKQRTKQN